MTVSDQYALFQILVGDNANDPRFSMAQFIILINAARKWFCEETKCFQVEDIQPTQAGVSQYTKQIDILEVETVEYDGVPLDPVQPRDWRGVIGYDDTIQGRPSVYKDFARVIQLFYVPSEIKNLSVRGRGYCSNLVANGGDPDLTDQQATGTVYRAAWQTQMIDKEDYAGLEKESLRIAGNIKAQYKPKGPRFVRTPGPFRGFLPGGSINV